MNAFNHIDKVLEKERRFAEWINILKFKTRGDIDKALIMAIIDLQMELEELKKGLNK